MSLKTWLPCVVVVLFLFGCASPQEAPEPETEPSCEATFRWFQKDAYADRAGRTSETWPPHTTTQIQVRCDDGSEFSAEQANHGTEVGAKTEQGEPILVEVHRETKPGTRQELEALLEAYRRCECLPVTEFLGLDLVEDSEFQQRLLEAVADYAEARIRCEASVSRAEIVGHVQARRIDQALAGLDSCSWGSDAGWEEAFQTAFGEVVDDVSEYHVCNNDALLQTGLWGRFQSGEPLPSCEDHDELESICRGPQWYYEP